MAYPENEKVSKIKANDFYLSVQATGDALAVPT